MQHLPNKSENILDLVIFWGICVSLLLVPLPFGLTEDWAIFLFEIFVIILVSIYSVKKIFFKVDNNSQVSKSSKLPFLARICLFIFAGVLLFHLIPLPINLLKFLSPKTFEIYAGVNQIGWKTLSLVPNLSWFKTVQYVCIFLFGFLILKSVKTKKKVGIFVIFMLVSAVFQSLYGMLELFGGTEQIFGYQKIASGGSATGTYINRNHFAGFLVMVFPISVGYLLAKADFFSIKRGLPIKEKLIWFSQERLQKTIVLGSVTVLIGMGIIFSRSRAGITIFIFLFFLVFLLISTQNRTDERLLGRRSKRILGNIILVILAAAFIIGVGPILNRFTNTKLSEVIRPIWFNNSLELINDFPLFGTGLGTYVQIYPAYKKVEDGYLLDHAHNDYLELAAETGLIGACSLVLFALTMIIVLFLKWRKRRDPFVRGVVLGCLLGIVAILLHSVVDFNLQIPANAVYFVALFALALGAVNLKE